jgi:hypothetical protein
VSTKCPNCGAATSVWSRDLATGLCRKCKGRRARGEQAQYAVLEADSAAKLAELVQGYIDRGWEPLGGVAAATKPESGWWYFQAMGFRGEDPSGPGPPGGSSAAPDG